MVAYTFILCIVYCIYTDLYFLEYICVQCACVHDSDSKYYLHEAKFIISNMARCTSVFKWFAFHLNINYYPSH